MLKGKFKDQAGNTYTSAFLEIAGARIDFVNEVANFTLHIYKSETAKKDGFAPCTTVKLPLQPEASEILPAFGDVLGTEKLADPDTNPLTEVLAIIPRVEQLKDFA